MQTVVTRPGSSTGEVLVPDGTSLLVRTWAAADPAWAAALLVHGLGEHSGRYERTAGILAGAGIAVTAVDLRGHGGSGGRRGDVERWSDYLDDIAFMLGRVRSTAGGRPVVLIGHSLGGLLCTDYVLSGRPQPDLLVLSAPALEDQLPGWQHAVAGLAARVVPRLALKHAWPPEALSRDPEVGRLAHDDPGCPPRATVRLGAFGFAAQERVQTGLSRLRLPTLVIHGGDDPLVPPSASERYEGLPGVTRRVYPGLRHESLQRAGGAAGGCRRCRVATRSREGERIPPHPSHRSVDRPVRCSFLTDAHGEHRSRMTATLIGAGRAPSSSRERGNPRRLGRDPGQSARSGGLRAPEARMPPNRSPSRP